MKYKFEKNHQNITWVHEYKNSFHLVLKKKNCFEICMWHPPLFVNKYNIFGNNVQNNEGIGQLQAFKNPFFCK
jgi:hypothetical protein